MSRQQREGYFLAATFFLLVVLGAAAALTAANGSTLLAGVLFLLAGGAIIAGRQTIWPPDARKMGWASWSVLNRANWRQWPKPWFVAHTTVIGGVLLLIGVSLVVDDLTR